MSLARVLVLKYLVLVFLSLFNLDLAFANRLDCGILHGLYVAKDSYGTEHVIDISQNLCESLVFSSYSTSGLGKQFKVELSDDKNDPNWSDVFTHAAFWEDQNLKILYRHHPLRDSLDLMLSDLLVCDFKISGRESFIRRCDIVDILGRTFAGKSIEFRRVDLLGAVRAYGGSLISVVSEDPSAFLYSARFSGTGRQTPYGGYKQCNDRNLQRALRLELYERLSILVERRQSGPYHKGFIHPKDLKIEYLGPVIIKGERYSNYLVRAKDNLGDIYSVRSTIDGQTNSAPGFLILSAKEERLSSGFWRGTNCCLGYRAPSENQQDGLTQTKKNNFGRLIRYELVNDRTGERLGYDPSGAQIFYPQQVAFACEVNFEK